jgi:CheY-like chemotaxis protein
MNSLLDQRQLRTVSTDSNVERTTLTSSVDRSEPAGFQGSSRVDFVGREMQRLMADPMVMIVGASPSLRSHMHQLVEQMGFRYVEASSVDDVFNTLRNATPVEAIFILDHLRDLDLGQLVQRIRINPSTSTVPIALLADSLSSLEHSVANSDPGVIVGSVPPTIDGFGDIVHRMDDVLGYPRTTAADRVGWKENAANYFRQRFPQEEVTDGTGVSIRLADTQAEQQNLLRIASDAQEPAKRREQASQIFVQSVQRFGLLISTDMINGQYDVYNTRGETEPVTRIVVGRVLDAIDAEYGRQTESNP